MKVGDQEQENHQKILEKSIMVENAYKHIFINHNFMGDIIFGTDLCSPFKNALISSRNPHNKVAP